MEFQNFYESISVEERKRIAKLAGISTTYLGLIAKGDRTPSADVSIVIERESSGRVRCETMRPSTDWAYIRGTGNEVRA